MLLKTPGEVVGCRNRNRKREARGSEREGEGDEERESKRVDANIPHLPVSPEDSRGMVHVAWCRVCLWFDSEIWADVPQAMNEIGGLVKGSLLVESMQTMVQTGVRPPREVTPWVTRGRPVLPTQERMI